MRSKIFLYLFLFFFAFIAFAEVENLFVVESVRITKSAQGTGLSVTAKGQFRNCLIAEVKTSKNCTVKDVDAKVYFFNSSKKRLNKFTSPPFPVKRGNYPPFSLPPFFAHEKTEKIYFQIPEEILKVESWFAIVIFGNKNFYDARIYPKGKLEDFDFPEQKGILKRSRLPDGIIEHVVPTGILEYPKLTLFLYAPQDMPPPSKDSDVLALCLLGGSPKDIAQKMLNIEAKDEIGSLLRYARQKRMVIIGWGARRLWNPRENWGDRQKFQNRKDDYIFDRVANAWERGIKELAEKYNIPQQNYLLWGISASAQYAARLALRKPEYFLAVHLHIPSSFDEPVKSANRPLWNLTTGENEVGYERSLTFLEACQNNGYPIIYKAIPGLGHREHPLANKICYAFFEYALSLKEEKKKFEEILKNPKTPGETLTLLKNKPWPQSFNDSVIYGDVINQKILDSSYSGGSFMRYKTALPSKKIEDLWRSE